MIKLAVIIINYKTPELVVDCLASLLPDLETIDDAKVVVVDNASGDDSVEKIAAWINKSKFQEKIDLIQSNENSGFSGGNNTGIQYVKAKYYLLLNSDTLVRKGAVLCLLFAAEQNQRVGLVSPRLEWPDGLPQESCFRFHTPVSELISSASTGIVTRLLKQFEVPYPVKQEKDFYDWTSFACVLVKADVMNDIGLMDDGYFMYFEDVAFSYKAQQAGWKVLNLPDAHVVHLRGGSSPVKKQTKLRRRLPRYFYESRTRFFYQAYGIWGLFLANVCWGAGHILALTRSTLSRSFYPPSSAYQWRDIWINFTNPLKPFIHPDHYDKT